MLRIERRRLLAIGLFSWLLGSRAPAKTRSRTFASIAELREYVMDALKRQPGVDSVVADPGDQARFTMVLGGEPSRGNVANVFAYIKANPDEDAEFIAGRFIRSIAVDSKAAVRDSNIVAVIRTREYIASMLGSNPSLLHEPLGADLTILYMADLPDSMAPIDAHEVPGKDLAGVREIALNNVGHWLPKVVSDDELGVGVLYYVEENPMLSPSLILIDDFWKSVAKRFPGDVLIALPRKDQLFLFDDNGNPETRAGVRRLITATFEENFNLLSPLLYARRNGKIMVVSD